MFGRGKILGGMCQVRFVKIADLDQCYQIHNYVESCFVEQIAKVLQQAS